MRYCLLIVIISFFAGSVCAQVQDNQVTWEEDELSVPSKKEPSFFKRPARKDPASQYEYAIELLDQGKLKAARKGFEVITYAWADSKQTPSAQLKMASIMMDLGAYKKAFKEFQYLIEYYPGQFSYEKVLDAQFKIANQIRTERWGDYLFLPGFSMAERSLPYFEQIVKNAPNWRRVSEVWLNIGLINEEMRQYMEAVRAYEKVIYRETLEQHLKEIAAFRRVMCLEALHKRQPQNQKTLRLAISSLFTFIKNYPDHEKVEVARQTLEELKKKLEDMAYEKAVFYDRISNQPKSALIAYRLFLDDFPFSDRAVIVRSRVDELSSAVTEE